MIHLVLLAGMVAAFALLCAADTRHQPHLFGHRRNPRESRVLRGAGWALICASIALACLALGAARGIIECLGLASIAACAQMAQLCRAMHRKRPAWARATTRNTRVERSSRT